MKTIPRRARSFFGLLILGAVLAVASVAGAADVSFYGVIKGENYLQGNPTTPSINENKTDEGQFFFNVFVDLNSFNSVTNASVQVPGSGAVKNLQLNQSGDSQEFKESFEVPLYLDGGYPNGDYVLTLKTKADGIKTIHLALAGSFTPIPVINNFNFLQAVPVASGSNVTFNVSWNAIAGGTANDYVQVQIQEESSMNGNSEIFSSPQPGQGGALNGTSSSVSIPANTLAAGKLYKARLMVVRGFFDFSSYGVVGVNGVVGYSRRTEFPIVTAGVAAVDFYAPQLNNSTPSTGEGNVATNVVVGFTFNERMQTNISLASSIKWSGGGISAANFNYTWSPDSKTLYCVYNTALPTGATIQWVLNPSDQDQNLLDLAGNLVNPDHQGQFTTASPTSGGLKDVKKIFLYKGKEAIQTNATTATASSVFQFGASADFTAYNNVTNGSLTVPVTGNVVTPQREDYPYGDAFEIQAKYDSQTDLDAFFPNGTYTFSLGTAHDGLKTLALSLTGNAYPNLPKISNSVFTAAQTVDSAKSITLGWEAFNGGGSGDYVQLDIENSNGDTIFKTPGAGSGGALTGTALSTTIPAGNLYPGRTYQARLMFIKVVNTDSASYSGVTARTVYFTETQFSLVTTGTPIKAQLAVQSHDVNQITLHLSGEPKLVYTVEASDTLTSGTWFQIGTQTADDTGQLTISDSSIFNRGHRFYRTREGSGN